MTRRKTTESTPLTALQEKFCCEYLVDLRPTRAAIRAGYSARTAKHIAHQTLGLPNVRKRIRKLMAERERESRVKRHLALEKTAAIAFSSIADYGIDATGHAVVAAHAHADAIKAVASAKRKVRTIRQPDGQPPIVEVETEIKLWNKVDALRLAAQHLGMLVHRHEHTGARGGPIAHGSVEIYMPDHVLTQEERAARITDLLAAARARMLEGRS